MKLDKDVEIKILKVENNDILVIVLAEDYYTPENANHVITAVKDSLKAVASDKKVGILVTRQPNEIVLMDDDMLLSLGLVKLNRMADNFTEEEMVEFMTKLGFEKTEAFQKVLNPKQPIESETLSLKYIIHTNEENTFEEMVKKYGVDIKECSEYDSQNVLVHPDKDYFHLYPRLDNKWVLPNKKGR